MSQPLLGYCSVEYFRVSVVDTRYVKFHDSPVPPGRDVLCDCYVLATGETFGCHGLQKQKTFCIKTYMSNESSEVGLQKNTQYLFNPSKVSFWKDFQVHQVTPRYVNRLRNMLLPGTFSSMFFSTSLKRYVLKWESSPNFQDLNKRNRWKHHLGVSENGGTPRSSILIGFSIINHKPSILGYHYFRKHPPSFC